MNILVTGSEGFISSHLIPKLKELDHSVIDMDIKNSNIENVWLYQACLSKTEGIDCVVHLAAQIDVQQSIERPTWYNLNNVDGTLNMLVASKQNKVKRFIFASSAAADLPQSPYGLTKLCGEQWCDIFNRCYGLSTISLRFFNVYGKGTDKGVIPTWIKAIKNGERPVIYGGNQVRDFIYVEDVVRAIICAMDCEATGVCEVGTGQGTTIYNLACWISSILKLDGKLEMHKQLEGEIQESIARHTSHTQAWIGFKSHYTIEQGLREMLK